MSIGNQNVCCHLTIHPFLLTFFCWDISRLHSGLYENWTNADGHQPVFTVSDSQFSVTSATLWNNLSAIPTRSTFVAEVTSSLD